MDMRRAGSLVPIALAWQALVACGPPTLTRDAALAMVQRAQPEVKGDMTVLAFNTEYVSGVRLPRTQLDGETPIDLPMVGDDRRDLARIGQLLNAKLLQRAAKEGLVVRQRSVENSSTQWGDGVILEYDCLPGQYVTCPSNQQLPNQAIYLTTSVGRWTSVSGILPEGENRANVEATLAYGPSPPFERILRIGFEVLEAEGMTPDWYSQACRQWRPGNGLCGVLNGTVARSSSRTFTFALYDDGWRLAGQ